MIEFITCALMCTFGATHFGGFETHFFLGFCWYALCGRTAKYHNPHLKFRLLFFLCFSIFGDCILGHHSSINWSSSCWDPFTNIISEKRRKKERETEKEQKNKSRNTRRRRIDNFIFINYQIKSIFVYCFICGYSWTSQTTTTHQMELENGMTEWCHSIYFSFQLFFSRIGMEDRGEMNQKRGREKKNARHLNNFHSFSKRNIRLIYDIKSCCAGMCLWFGLDLDLVWYRVTEIIYRSVGIKTPI